MVHDDLGVGGLLVRATGQPNFAGYEPRESFFVTQTNLLMHTYALFDERGAQLQCVHIDPAFRVKKILALYLMRP